MAQIDRLLTHVTPRGALRLRLEPNQPAVLDLPDGQTLSLLPQPLIPAMLESLAGEVIPAALQGEWNQRTDLSFDHSVGGEAFRITLKRGGGGISLFGEPRAVPAQPAIPQEAFKTAPQTAPQASAPATAQPAAKAKAEAAPRVSAGSSPGGGLELAHHLMRTLLARKGSDLHCTSNHKPSMRISGDLEELEDESVLEPDRMREMLIAVAPPSVWEHFESAHDADFAYPFEEGGCRLRVNYFTDRFGAGMVCRVIPNQIPDPDALGVPEPVKRLAMLPKGLVLVTGPTGSGKSTTLASIIDIANRKRKDHILTIEDPIEFVHPRKGCLVNQREVHTHTESFKSGLRAALREDPDIVLVGEMRDLETIAIAIETALTGHLVFGTLHTNSAIATVDRIVDQFPADRQQQIRVMLAESLKAVVSQILLKKIGGGRVAALETLFVGPAISNLIREGKAFQIASAMQTGRAYGQRMMVDALCELVKSGQVDPLEGYLKCPDKDTYIQGLKRAGVNFDPRANGETEI